MPPEFEYRGWGISTVQGRDGRWTASIASGNATTTGAAALASLIEKSQSYLSRFLAVMDLQIQIDDFGDRPAARLGADQRPDDNTEPMLPLSHQPFAGPGAEAEFGEDTNPELPPMVDKRRRLRKKALLGGVVVHNAGQYAFRCAIRDLAESGARIEFPNGQVFPASVYLINIGARTGHEAKVTWVRDSEAGLTFVNSFDLNEPGDPKTAYLNKIWVDYSPRYASGLELP